MTKDEALKMAIEAFFRFDDKSMSDKDYFQLCKDASFACKKALEQQSWKGLSSDMVRAIGEKCQEENRGILNWIDFYNAIESMLKEKNYE